jgi:hypothetical protein
MSKASVERELRQIAHAIERWQRVVRVGCQEGCTNANAMEGTALRPFHERSR